MNDRLREIWEKKLRPYVKKDNLILLVLAGILLLVIAIPVDRKAEKGKTIYTPEAKLQSEQSVEMRLSAGNDANETEYSQEINEEDYRKMLQKEVASILSRVDGAGEVAVMITFKESTEKVVEKDSKKTQKQTGEMTLGGAEKTAGETNSQENTVMDGREDPFVIKSLYPKIEGVLVLAQGVGKGHVRADITEAVQALFGLEAHRIKVLRLGHIQSIEGIE